MLPSLDPDHFGGFPGMYMSSLDQGDSELKSQRMIDLIGPATLAKHLYSHRYFMGMMNLGVKHVHIEEEKEEKVGGLSTEMISTFKNDDCEIIPVSNANSDGKKSHISFIVKPARSRGTFLPKKAIAMGVKPGFNFRKLTEGIEITLEDGTVVKPSDCCEPSLPSQGFIVNFIPDESYIQSVITNPIYEEYFEENIDSSTQIVLIYHSILDPAVLENEDYL